TGPWAEQLAALAGIGSVRLALARGLMIAFEGRPVSTVINRCRPPGDGDILVPTGGVCVLGTTDRPTRDPDQETVDQGEVETLLEQGQMLVPSLRQTSVLRAWTGVRPLFDETGASETGTSETGSPEAGARTLTRTHALLDHGRRDGVHGFITITGGKLTTFRLMAEETVGAVCAQLGDARTCTTATHPLPAPCRSA
ncbi:MAG: FAD-dependent oxidoreductase, partial [Solirubrobacteraceae bacterium]